MMEVRSIVSRASQLPRTLFALELEGGWFARLCVVQVMVRLELCNHASSLALFDHTLGEYVNVHVWAY